MRIKFQGDTRFTGQVTGDAIEKAIRPFLQTGSHDVLDQIIYTDFSVPPEELVKIQLHK